jgi:ABC-type dipeptide/oligopeptide/nickel transport system permease subunit
MLSRQDPIAIGDVLALRLLPPFSRDSTGAFHLLGTDRFGRDLFVRMMLAGRISLAVGIVGSLFAGAVGTAVGAVSAWLGGFVDRLAMAISDALLALPRLVLLLVCAALWRPGLLTVVLVLVLTGWMGVAPRRSVRHPAECCGDTRFPTRSVRQSSRRRSASATRSYSRAASRSSGWGFNPLVRAGGT